MSATQYFKSALEFAQAGAGPQSTEAMLRGLIALAEHIEAIEAKIDTLEQDELAGLKSDMASVRSRTAAIFDHLGIE